MNFIRYNLLTLCLATASLHAMDDVHIVPFDYAKHGTSIANLFEDNFFRAYIPSILKGNPTINKTEKADVIIRGTEEPIGFITHETAKSTYANTFIDLTLLASSVQYINSRNDYKSLAAQLKDAPLRIKEIDYLAIDAYEQGNGLGSRLIEHVEKQARDEQCDFIRVTCRKPQPHQKDPRKFYIDHNNFKMTSPWRPFQLAKPLTPQADNILKIVYDVRDHAHEGLDVLL